MSYNRKNDKFDKRRGGTKVLETAMQTLT